MQTLISSRSSDFPAIPDSYVQPPERRPHIVPPCKTIPVIDLDRLGHDRTQLVQQIIKAGQEYGFFQLTNHGVPEELIEDVLKVGQEFFELPMKERERFYTDDPNQFCRLKTSFEYGKEKVHFWRDNLRHHSHPLEEYIHLWPENPARYKEVVGQYSLEVRRVALQLLDLICEGLGLESGYFTGELSQKQFQSINYYPPCPDPSLVLGLPKHADPYLLTLLNQGHLPGLQVFKDDQWLAVEPVPNAFVININHMLQIISNGKLKSAYHRVVANSNAARITSVTFISPPNDSLIEPAKSILNQGNPPIYKSVKVIDLLTTYIAETPEEKETLELYMV